MKLNDLKDGMILELRNGKRYLLVNEIMRDFDGYIRLSSYNNNLIYYMRNRDFDIVKVYKDTRYYSLRSIFKDEYLTLIWERKETKLTDRETKLTDREIETLKAFKDLGFKYIARDLRMNAYNGLYAYEERPSKCGQYWWWHPGCWIIGIPNGKDLFDFIKWEDEEPTSIGDLLKELEK